MPQHELPALDIESGPQSNYHAFFSALRRSEFSGDIEFSYASRLAVATDNSIYQALPQGVVLPKSVADLQVIGELASQYNDVSFSARGGGTGTNGQSLTSGIIVDVSRHMNNILEINPQERWVKVQAGVVKDQLNDALRPYGLFFAPDLSTSNRATIGGMISTDASGQGSLVYGKTSDHVLGLTSVLADGTLLETAPMDMEQAKQVAQQQNITGRLVKQILATCVDKREQILAKFPRMNRFLTGYDLEHALNDDLTKVDISRVITGSEGSLVFVAEAKLNVTPISKHKALVNIKYDSFESALRHAPHMVAANATSVETVDSNVLNLAKQDIIWHQVKELITEVENKEVLGLNMVEYNGDSEEALREKITLLSAKLDAALEGNEGGVIGYQITYDNADIGKIYAMRKKSVGLLGKTKGRKKPLAFVEDTGVPPENLADFIMEFRALLDARNLHYGMFGHVDAGVLHVRPALDMCDPEQEATIPDISNEVSALVAKYGGLLWGEHGKGYRSEYAPAFFGEELYEELRKIKAAFDPHNKMNPGKICTPIESSAPLVSVGGVKRGEFDRQIPITVRDAFGPAMNCNGNGLCFNYDTTSTMCPSSKITSDRRHSPKGRAGAMREWLRLLANNQVDVNALELQGKNQNLLKRLNNSMGKAQSNDFSHEVLEVMDGCLACKACSTQCPVSVDVPTFRARFLSLYYQRYMRPAKDYLVGNIEAMAPLMAKAPKLVNAFLKQAWMNKLIKKTVGYVDTPLLSSPSLKKQLAGHEATHFNLGTLQALSASERAKKVLIVQDPFTSFYEAGLLHDLVKLIECLGYEPILLPFMPNGKPQHVKGFLKEFAATAKDSADFLNKLAPLGIPMVGVDPSLVLCYRDEYKKVLGDTRGSFEVTLVHEWLATITLPERGNTPDTEYAFFGHCTEKTALPESEKHWQQLFQRMGMSLTPISVGCCGMAGTFGHEASHLEQSKGIYALSWEKAVAKFKTSQILATGYSCRSQVARIEGEKPKHPLQAMLAHLS
ncbi:Fe-S oxidoreductase [Paraglaciecola mesophila KMM 241]|uniref:D-2-hydroxyglutarate dehydrogenase n=1 Tax=Paraglaciecola mesophila KMM 241 TaxID=1128912 RepID=K6YJU1_9ALTE|nr:FAD-binding and (Fe-S)-binding domain-containing protein [Paraglaciecola mesophila]GAC24266.1 Fe-S oxidoreductase [Paraglaciecola mesophila KMM 241]